MTRSWRRAASTWPAPLAARFATTPTEAAQIARLIHLNGPPGSGKSTVARRWLDDHPLALLIEIDEIRTRLGGWRVREETQLMARSLALSMAREHLSAGHDVIVPQYLGRPDFIERLETVAGECGAEFVEIVLMADASVAADRFRARRAELSAAGAAHPEADVDDADIEAAVDDAVARLEGIVGSWPRAVSVAADGDTAEVGAAVDAALRERR